MTTKRLRAFTGSARRREFGRYETLFRIASGGMAEVYAARVIGEGGFERVVALKRMLPTLGEDDRFVTMFLDEGRLAANINSPHVVHTLDLGRSVDDSLYLVMDLVVGISLGDLLKELSTRGEVLPIDIAVGVLVQAATGLHDAHQARTPTGVPLEIVHRDVSPQNILIDRTGRAQIVDFGIAYALERVTLTRTNEFKGKVAYVAPEQIMGEPIDHRADIFSLGVVAWEALTGQRLFRRTALVDALKRILWEPIPAVDMRREEVDAALSTVVAKALNRAPEDRFESAEEFAGALSECVPLPSAARIAEFVRGHDGGRIAELERRIRRALSDTPRTAIETITNSEPDPTPSGARTAVQTRVHRQAASRRPVRIALALLVFIVAALAILLPVGSPNSRVPPAVQPTPVTHEMREKVEGTRPVQEMRAQPSPLRSSDVEALTPANGMVRRRVRRRRRVERVPSKSDSGPRMVLVGIDDFDEGLRDIDGE